MKDALVFKLSQAEVKRLINSILASLPIVVIENVPWAEGLSVENHVQSIRKDIRSGSIQVTLKLDDYAKRGRMFMTISDSGVELAQPFDSSAAEAQQAFNRFMQKSSLKNEWGAKYGDEPNNN